MRRNPGEGMNPVSDSGSSDDDVNLSYKRNKRGKRCQNQDSVDEVDFRKCSKRNGGTDIPEVIRHQKLDTQKHDSSKKVLPKIKPKENGEAVFAPGGITYKASATEIMIKKCVTIQKQMGFSNSVGLGQLMNSHEVGGDKLEEMEDYIKTGGIVIDDESLDMAEELSVEEEIKWITPVFAAHPCDFQHLSSWRKVGPRKSSIKNENEFVDPAALNRVSELRKCFDCFNEHEYQQLRARCNPFESVGKGPFVCRAGMKMASLDAVMSYALTQPTTNSTGKQSVLTPNDLFYFADVCAGPGGFSEYILFRKKWGAKGFGMTLKGKLDFDTWSFFTGSPESFEPFYGPADDGNVYNPSNTSAFINHVLASTENRGVHLMMADGGFEVENKELTEIHSAQIYLSQCYLALSLVRPGGMFVCKFFDTLTPFSIGLIYLMYISFDLVSIHKPNASRPANSERYLVCKWKKTETEGIARYLNSCHELYWKWTCHNNGGPLKEDIIELVPIEVLKMNKEFLEYIVRINTVVARRQAKYLEKMVIFARDPNMRDPRSDKIKKKCFEFWKIPISSNKAAPVQDREQVFRSLVGGQPADFLGCQEYQLTEHNLEAFIRSPYDWRVVGIEADSHEKNRGFYLSLGHGRIYRYDGKSWTHILETLELCKETLVYGEFVDEIYGKKPSQGIIKTFHIIDAMMLGGTDVRGMHYTTRHEVCVKFAKSMNKPSRPGLCHVRAKIPVRMENIADIFDRLENRVVTGSGLMSQLICPVDHTDETLPFIKPAGILFLKITKDPWTMALSRSSNRKYYFNLTTGASNYDLVPESISSFEYTMQNRVVWEWNKELKSVLSTQDVTNESRPVTVPQSILNPQTLLRFVGGEWQNNRTAVMRRLSSSSSNHSSS